MSDDAGDQLFKMMENAIGHGPPFHYMYMGKLWGPYTHNDEVKAELNLKKVDGNKVRYWLSDVEKWQAQGKLLLKLS